MKIEKNAKDLMTPIERKKAIRWEGNLSIRKMEFHMPMPQ